MSTTINLVAIPKEGEILLRKAERRGESDEYSSIFFSISRAFEESFNTYGHKDWIEFKADVASLQQYYPTDKFESKYDFDTNSKYEVFEYLFAKYQKLEVDANNRLKLSFFKSTNECKCQGRNFEYWNNEQTIQKLNYLNSINSHKLFEYYNPEIMIECGVYKIRQAKKELIEKSFEALKVFLNESIKLKGYTLILQW